MRRTLHLTSPLMSGTDVMLAQRRLRGENRYDRNFLPGTQDGEYGPMTAGAARAAKWWLGYPKSRCVGTYGSMLESYLAPGGRKRSLAMNLRAAYRRREARRKQYRLAALTQARTQVGITEMPAGTNQVKFSAWYGLVGPWCAMFVSWCYTQAGRPLHYAYCPYIVADAEAGRNGLRAIPASAVVPGDLVLFDWDGDGVADHVGLFVGGRADAAFTTVEGNTSLSNESNGGAVMMRTRVLSQVRAFVAVDPT